jgi:hypothetical protein
MSLPQTDKRITYKSFIITAERGTPVHGVVLVHFKAVQEHGILVLCEGWDDCSMKTAVQFLKTYVDKHWKIVL